MDSEDNPFEMIWKSIGNPLDIIRKSLEKQLEPLETRMESIGNPLEIVRKTNRDPLGFLWKSM